MKQVLQNLRSGQTIVEDVPAPMVGPGRVLIQTRASLISAGTERMLVEFGKSSLFAKARAQPDKVRQVLAKIKTEGLLPTLEAVFSRLDEPMPLGYCNAGVVLAVGDDIRDLAPGDRVVSNGPHAEIVAVPRNLCARIPDNVTDEQAAVTVLASIALQGVRLIGPTLGECIVVTGLGLIGLTAVQLLAANGCRVLGIDVNPDRLALARKFGAETVDLSAGADPLAAAVAFSNGVGVDGVLIAAASKSNDIMRQAAAMCRKRGRIVLVGVVGLELNRSDFYKKELIFQVSCSYGPGRYDVDYEDCGLDYPIGFVRWTEQRNFQAILQLLAAGRLDVAPLISERVEHAQAGDAYEKLTSDRDALGIILTYPQGPPPMERVIPLGPASSARPADRVVIGMIGAGNFAKMSLLPAIKGLPVTLKIIASAGGVTAAHTGRKFGFQQAASDYRAAIADPEINLVVILTRHNLHAKMVVEALRAGKHVAVEKPLCLNREQLAEVRDAFAKASAAGGSRQLLVGFNRRFSPHAVRIKSLLAGRTQPLCMSMMVNAGVTPPESWTQDASVGGGRIIGEGCHWIDLMSFLAGSQIVRVVATCVGESPGLAVRDDKMTVTLSFADGSIGTLHYFGNGHKEYPKETLELYSDGRILRLDNFRRLCGFGWRGFSKMNLWRMDKGYVGEFGSLVAAILAGGPPVMPFEQIDNVMQATFAAVESARSGQPADIR